jgi:hypothetical protein
MSGKGRSAGSARGAELCHPKYQNFKPKEGGFPNEMERHVFLRWFDLWKRSRVVRLSIPRASQNSLKSMASL